MAWFCMVLTRETYKMQLQNLIQKIHEGCFTLCKQALGKYLPVAGNIGIFCQSKNDFAIYTKIREEITYPSNNPDQKYFELKIPIVVHSSGDVPEATYTHLYIRKPNINSPESGDVDFVLSPSEYLQLKQKILNGEKVEGASIYDRPGWDNIEIRNPKIDALAYISTQEMAEKVRVKF